MITYSSVVMLNDIIVEPLFVTSVMLAKLFAVKTKVNLDTSINSYKLSKSLLLKTFIFFLHPHYSPTKFSLLISETLDFTINFKFEKGLQ